MSSLLKAYAHYQPMDAPWCPKIPRHWQSKRLGSVLKERGEVNHDYAEQNVLSVLRDIGVIPYADKGNIGNKKSEDIARYKIVRPNDIVLNSMNVIIGSVGRSRYQGCLSPVYYVLTPRNLELTPEFAESIFQVKPFQQSLIRIGYGILAHRMRIPMELLKSEVLPLPPPDEQVQIVRFIRHLDQRVNRLIKTKRRLIELLNEQKQAIIHRAVTRGLDPTVHLKPSGIEWLGDVPSHWRVMGLRLRYSVELGKMLDAKRISGDHLIPYLRNTDVQWDNIRSTNLPEMDIRPDEYERYTVRRGDLLVCEGGEVGRAAMWSQTDRVVGFQKALHRLRPRCVDADNPRFLMYVLFYVAKKGVFKADGSENTIAHLTSEKLRKYRFAFPERAEQDMLVEHIDQESSDINLVIEKTQSEIDFIREYRTRLVADVVTGQLDVRHLALPEVEESLIEAIDAGDGDDSEELEEPEVDA